LQLECAERHLQQYFSNLPADFADIAHIADNYLVGVQGFQDRYILLVLDKRINALDYQEHLDQSPVGLTTSACDKHQACCNYLFIITIFVVPIY
jgi:hypothetical protein